MVKVISLEKREAKHGMLVLYDCFGLSRERERERERERNRRALENVELSDQKLKSLFLCNFLEWTKGGLEVGSMYMFDFVNGLNARSKKRCNEKDIQFTKIKQKSYGKERIHVANHR